MRRRADRLIAPMMPWARAKRAQRGGMPPSASVTEIATGVVAALVATVRSRSSPAPSARAIRTAETIDTAAPTTTATTSGTTKPLSRSAWRCSGTASATVAGPSQKATSSVALRYSG